MRSTRSRLNGPLHSGCPNTLQTDRTAGSPRSRPPTHFTHVCSVCGKMHAAKMFCVGSKHSINMSWHTQGWASCHPVLEKKQATRSQHISHSPCACSGGAAPLTTCDHISSLSRPPPPPSLSSPIVSTASAPAARISLARSPAASLRGPRARGALRPVPFAAACAAAATPASAAAANASSSSLRNFQELVTEDHSA